MIPYVRYALLEEQMEKETLKVPVSTWTPSPQPEHKHETKGLSLERFFDKEVLKDKKNIYFVQMKDVKEKHL